MKLIEWFNKWEIKNLKINATFLEVELSFNDTDKKAAWEMYIELITRATTQTLKPEEGDEISALESIFTLFSITREILKKYGTTCIEFSKIAIIILNQKIRPFTSKWHKISKEGGFQDQKMKNIFRDELAELQVILRNYSRLLSEISEVEDITQLER